MTKKLIDPEEITSNYEKTNWFDVACIVAISIWIAYVIAHFVLWLV